MWGVPAVVSWISCILVVSTVTVVCRAGEHEAAHPDSQAKPDTPDVPPPEVPPVPADKPSVPPDAEAVRSDTSAVRPDSRRFVPAPVHAVRTHHPPTIDGRLDDPAWAEARVFTAFLNNQPVEGEHPSERSELRVLFDDEKLYISMKNFDSQPGSIMTTLGRRDTEPQTSDYVSLYVATDGRTAHRFFVNAGGSQGDTLIYDDTIWLQSWDGVWESATTVGPDGWIAEVAIPLHLLDVDGRAQSWGFLARRSISRTHEVLSSAVVPRAANGFVSYFGVLDGVGSVPAQRALEVVPYVATRSVLRPQYGDAGRPSPRLWLGSADIGAALALFPGHGLTINATLNPDFGEVQPDQLLLNVTSFETYYPEQRPFFTQGMDLFQTVGGQDQLQSMFYSRRIGLDVPILGAVKVTGRPIPGLAVGFVDALVDGPWQRGADENSPDASVSFHAERPFHLGPTDELPATEVIPENFVAATARVTLAGRSWVGARFSAATPLDGSCSAADLAMKPLPGRCTLGGLNAFGLDTSLKTDSGDWGIYGQLAVAQAVLGAPRVEKDGTVINPGDAGTGGFVRAGKLGGEGFRLQLGYDYEAPRFDLNAVGFQLDQNLHDSHLDVGVSYPNGFGPFIYLDAWVHSELAFSADGRDLRRSGYAGFEVNAQIPGYHFIHLTGGWNAPWWDIRELGGSGVAMNTSSSEGIKLIFDGDANQPLALHGMIAFGHHDAIGPTPDRVGFTFEAGATWHATAALLTQILATLDRTPWDPRYLARLDPTHFLLGRLDADTLTITLRQDWGITPRLTLQAYLQLLTAYGSYGSTYQGQGTPGAPLRQEELVAVARPMPDPSFHTAELVANLVARWEYRPGSTLFLVYSRTMDELPPGVPDRTLGASRLLDGPAVDLVLVKWAQFFSL